MSNCKVQGTSLITLYKKHKVAIGQPQNNFSCQPQSEGALALLIL